MPHTDNDAHGSGLPLIDKLDLAVFGNGKVGLVTQMALTEQTVKRIDKSLTWIVRLLTATLLTAVAGVIVALVVGHK